MSAVEVLVWTWTGGAGEHGRLVQVRAAAAAPAGTDPADRVGDRVLPGLPHETRDRLRAAIVNSGQRWPVPEVRLALPPAAAAVGYQAMDAALAVAVLAAAGGSLQRRRLPRVAVIGELGLDGRMREGQELGVIAAAAAAAGPAAGVREVLVPAAVAGASIGSGMPASGRRRVRIVGVENLAELVVRLGAGGPRVTG